MSRSTSLRWQWRTRHPTSSDFYTTVGLWIARRRAITGRPHSVSTSKRRKVCRFRLRQRTSVPDKAELIIPSTPYVATLHSLLAHTSANAIALVVLS
ncbi:hypothetical protein EVAR_83319_1 [Eumeta japonica]|uniref:Uncharacterized protein n=1 Tax=Eumeta variegata TaxID=151549 RepID=A0A4C1VWR5_EUMVA|nr:hypothetical protein EVAR_83319_1 [Eumeta japonica]